jgi:hypothetical protein
MSVQPHFDITAFEDAISAHGVRVVHFRAMRCPVGLIDIGDGRQPDHDHSGCSNGYLYTRAGTLRALFTGNTEAHRMTQVGLVDGSTVQVTVQRYYEDDEGNAICTDENEVQIANFDRLYLDEPSITVPTWQLFKAHVTGKDRLQFPVVKVFDLVGNDGERYAQDKDFAVVGGYIKWTGDRRPAPDSICAIRYTYRPYWYVKQLMHQVRVVTQDEFEDGARKVERMPQAMVLEREYIFEKEAKDELAPDPLSPAQVKSPPSGSFGAR